MMFGVDGFYTIISVLTLVLVAIFYLLTEKQLKRYKKESLFSNAMRAETMVISTKLSIDYLSRVKDYGELVSIYDRIELPEDIDRKWYDDLVAVIKKRNEEDYAGYQMLDVFKKAEDMWMNKCDHCYNEIIRAGLEKEYGEMSYYFNNGKK
jgi:hypothetical protein